MNYMKQVAEMLGVKMGERFNITNKIDGHIMRDDYYLTDEGLMREGFTSSHRKMLADILAGKIKVVKKPWKPTIGDIFYYIATSGEIRSNVYCDDAAIYAMQSMGNTFCTPAEAEPHIDEMVAKFKEVRFG